MKTDAYTKVVLTVIACCLLYFVIRDATVVPPAHASTVVDVNIVKVAGNTIYEAAVPVKLK